MHSNDKIKIIDELKIKNGKKNIITAEWRKQRYCKGWRYGEGDAIAVAKPGTLLEIWELKKICVENDIIIIVQVSNFWPS